MFLDDKNVLEMWLNPGLNLTIFRGTGPRRENTCRLRACLHQGGAPQVSEVTHIGGVTRMSI